MSGKMMNTSKNKRRCSQQKMRILQKRDKITEVKQKIMNVKDKIKQEKDLLKKKLTVNTNQSEILKNKKIATLESPKEKIRYRRYQGEFH